MNVLEQKLYKKNTNVTLRSSSFEIEENTYLFQQKIYSQKKIILQKNI